MTDIDLLWLALDFLWIALVGELFMVSAVVVFVVRNFPGRRNND